MPAFSFLPPEANVDSIAACIGLISDTHMPQRCAALPLALAEVFGGVDLLLHAGDVGELWVLDQLSRIAPIIAVHGNDETADAQRELPYQQVITVAGQRIVLCHSHYPIRHEEMESRRHDEWQPKLAHLARMAQGAGASIVVYGHTHIPMACEYEGALLINSGAIASGSAIARQLIQTVALLFIRESQPPLVVHVDLARPSVTYRPDIDLAAGFRAALDHYSASILDEELASSWPLLQDHMLALLDNPADKQAFDVLYAALLVVSHRCWAGQQTSISRGDLLAMFDSLKGERRIPMDLLGRLRTAIEG